MPEIGKKNGQILFKSKFVTCTRYDPIVILNRNFNER